MLILLKTICFAPCKVLFQSTGSILMQKPHWLHDWIPEIIQTSWITKFACFLTGLTLKLMIISTLNESFFSFDKKKCFPFLEKEWNSPNRTKIFNKIPIIQFVKKNQINRYSNKEEVLGLFRYNYKQLLLLEYIYIYISKLMFYILWVTQI